MENEFLATLLCLATTISCYNVSSTQLATLHRLPTPTTITAPFKTNEPDDNAGGRAAQR